MKPQSQTQPCPTIEGDVKIESGFAKKIEGTTDNTGIVNVEIEPNENEVLWCIIYGGNPLKVMGAYQTNVTAEFSFARFPSPWYVTHWEQIGNTMNQLDINT